MARRVVGLVGSYRKGGTIDCAVDAILEGARAQGAETSKIYLRDLHIEFCTNCRQCMQEPGPERGRCVQQDDLDPLLDQMEAADAIVLGAPVNCFNLNALFRRFMERLVGYGYWPWGTPMPKGRERAGAKAKKAALVTSAAMPAPFIPVATGAPRALKWTAKILGAKPEGVLWIGTAAQQPETELAPKVIVKAKKLGAKLV